MELIELVEIKRLIALLIIVNVIVGVGAFIYFELQLRVQRQIRDKK